MRMVLVLNAVRMGTRMRMKNSIASLKMLQPYNWVLKACIIPLCVKLGSHKTVCSLSHFPAF
jgi:hypothetical protein